MGQVSVTLNGRTYRLECGDGEEAHLIELAEYLSSHVETMKFKFGQVGDDRLILMAALMVADELTEARRQLDEILVRAAVAAGVELREAFTVDELVFSDERVTGVVGHARNGGTVRETARYVIGAEGHHSLVAKSVQAPMYREREALTGGYYSYWSGVELDGAAIYISDRGGVLAFPTNEGRVCIAAGKARQQFAERIGVYVERNLHKM